MSSPARAGASWPSRRRTPPGKLLYAPYGPVAESLDAFDAALAALAGLARRCGAVFVRIEPVSAGFGAADAGAVLRSRGLRARPGEPAARAQLDRGPGPGLQGRPGRHEAGQPQPVPEHPQEGCDVPVLAGSGGHPRAAEFPAHDGARGTASNPRATST